MRPQQAYQQRDTGMTRIDTILGLYEAALAGFEHRDEVRVTWRSFELDPSAPAERPEDGATHLAAKYGTTRAEALAMHEQMTRTAAADGLDFRFDLARGANTFDAHRQLHLAAVHGRQDALKERIMRKWRKSQLQAFIDKYGPSEGSALFRWLKIHAARARRGE